MSIAPYARFSYLKKKEAVIELLPVRQDNVCGILPAISCPAAVKIGGAGACDSARQGGGASSRRLPVVGRVWAQSFIFERRNH
jgi:hypothetical protein